MKQQQVITTKLKMIEDEETENMDSYNEHPQKMSPFFKSQIEFILFSLHLSSLVVCFGLLWFALGTGTVVVTTRCSEKGVSANLSVSLLVLCRRV